MSCSPHGTHHLACDCREAEFAARYAEMEQEIVSYQKQVRAQAEMYRRLREERDALASRLARAEEALREIADLDCDGGCGCAQRIARTALAPGEKEEPK